MTRSPAPPPPARSPSASPVRSLPLAQLLGHCAQAVEAVLAGRSLSDALADCPEPARPGAQALAFDVMRRLEGALAASRHMATRRPPPPVEALLVCALALLWPGAQARYEPHTLVDQAVAAVRRRYAGSAGFVNALLRRFLRERELLVPQLEEGDPAVRWQHPRWWVQQLRSDWPDQAEALLRANQCAAPMWLRVNLRQTDAPTYVEELRAAGLPGAVARGRWAVCLAEAVPVQRLPGFFSGRVSVQDLSAQLCAPLLLGRPQEDPDELLRQTATDLPAGARVLDACAAPGGKTAQLLELADLNLLALDVDRQRLARVGQTLDRLGLQADCRCADAAEVATWWDGRPFDAILLDAPCSASGIVRRHPDVRRLRRRADIDELARIQARLLDALWPLLKPGGRLVFTTCSLFRAEGQAQVDAFLQRTTTGIRRPCPGHLLGFAENPPSFEGAAGWSGDGFFHSRLDKAV
ncbi:MAG TPA: 16S rRNA (cytosine(967)-C(5))-methyltransferase RsmB [Burkholderiaceae bacterium]|nr:16S rRNA (cytosine(967)-C(5))-methyltransferase RsmB [Burkholderiaceae bacterium]